MSPRGRDSSAPGARRRVMCQARLGRQVERAVNEVLSGECMESLLDGAWVAEVTAGRGVVQVTLVVPHRDLDGALEATRSALARFAAAVAAEVGGKHAPALRFRVVSA